MGLDMREWWGLKEWEEVGVGGRNGRGSLKVGEGMEE